MLCGVLRKITKAAKRIFAYLFLNEPAKIVFTIIIAGVRKRTVLALTIAIVVLAALWVTVPTKSNITTCRLAAKYYGKDRITEPPNMIEFQSLSIFQKVTYNDAVSLGIFLLEDETGSKVKGITDMAKSVEDLNREIFRRWLKREGKQPTNWDTLISGLRKIKLHKFANQIKRKVAIECIYVNSLPYSYSEVILKSVESLKKKYLEQKVVMFDLLKQNNELPFLDIFMTHADKVSPTSRKSLQTVITDFNEDDVHKQLLIVGQPGSGKTTLIRYLSKMWAKGELLQSCQILFVLYLGKCKGEYHNLSDLLKVVYKDINIPFEEISHRNGEGACLLMDAFDEKLNKRDYVYELMHNNELPLSRRILTSRPDDDLVEVTNSYEIIGYELTKLDTYLDLLTTNEAAKGFVKGLWKESEVKEMCQLPLHMGLVVFIAQTSHASSIKTKTQIYIAFMNATIKHYKRSHPQWNTVSLRECILEKSSHSDDKLCSAFKSLHTMAFQKTIMLMSTFSLKVEVREELNKLGFVSVVSENSANDEVSILFSHRTFAEFFTSIHLLTMSLDEQIFWMQNSELNDGLITQFYFGLLGNFHADNFTAVSLPFRYFSTTIESSCGLSESNSIFLHLASLRMLEEIGWTGDNYRNILNSAGIITNSSAHLIMVERNYEPGERFHNSLKVFRIFEGTKDFQRLHYFIENSLIHRFSLTYLSNINKRLIVPLATVSLYDPDHYLSTSHIHLLHCFKYTNCSLPKEILSAVKYYHLTMTISDHSIITIISMIKRIYEMFIVESFAMTLTVSYSELLLRNCDHSIQIELWNYLSYFNISTLNVVVELDICIEEVIEILRTCTLPYITTLNIYMPQSCTQLKSTSSISSVLKRPDKLQSVNIFGRLPNESLSTILSGLTSLKHLGIICDYNHNSSIMYETIANSFDAAMSKTLVELDLSHCRLHGSAMKALAKKFYLFPELQTLQLAFFSLADSDLNILSEYIQQLHSLRYLSLPGNEINGKELPSLVKSQRTIEYLNLYDNPITGAQNIEALAQLTHLQDLYITVVTKEDKETLFNVTRRLHSLKVFEWNCHHRAKCF